MKFKMILEELDPNGKWVTLANGHKAHISSDGTIETGILKGVNLNDKESIEKRIKSLQKDEKNKL